LDGYYPLIHCGTSFGHYKETREEIIHHPELRDQVRRIMDRLKMPFVFPEEIVHYSEWVHAMRHRIAERQVLDFSDITVTVHPACHYHNWWWKMPSMTANYMMDNAQQLSRDW
jgi:heterodisulfide reductase subunit B